MQVRGATRYAVGCAALVAIGAVGPWVKVWLFLTEVTAYGLSMGRGQVVLVSALATAGLLMWFQGLDDRKGAAGLAVIGFGLTAVIGVVTWADLAEAGNEWPVAVGWGLVVVVLASILGVILVLVAAARAEQAAKSTSSVAVSSPVPLGARRWMDLSPDVSQPLMRLIPSYGFPGVTVETELSGFAAGSLINIVWHAWDGSSFTVASLHASNDGSGRCSFVVPTWESEGSRRLEATSARSGRIAAAFTVTASPIAAAAEVPAQAGAS